MITEKEYLMGIQKYNKFLFFISIGIAVDFIIFLKVLPLVYDKRYEGAVILVVMIILILRIPHIILAIFQAIAAYKKSDKKETLIYKKFSMFSIVGLAPISPIIIFFLLRSDLKKLDEK